MSYTAVTKQGGGTPEKKSWESASVTGAAGWHCYVYGIVRQWRFGRCGKCVFLLPFPPGRPLLLRALPFCCCSHDGAGAVYREYPGGSVQNRFCTDDLSVVHGWKTGTLGGDIYHLAHMEIPAHPFGRAGILTEDNLNAEAQRNSQR